jgi:GNAT superfamily N-acetyltransferase
MPQKPVLQYGSTMISPPKDALSINAIQRAFQEISSSVGLEDHTLKRLEVPDVEAVLNKLGTKTCLSRLESIADGFESSPPLYHGLVLLQKNTRKENPALAGFVICYLAYSTWQGRVLFLNKLHLEQSAENLLEPIMHVLANIAIRLECRRLVWNHDDSSRQLYAKMGAETLDGWLTLRMDRDGIQSFVHTNPDMVPTGATIHGPLSVSIICDIFDKVLIKTNNALKDSGLTLKRATRDDIASIQRLVQGLADYEKEPDVVQTTRDQFRLDGFDTDTPLYHCLLLEDATTCLASGMAFIFFGYDASFGRFLYLEDLFFEEQARGKGAGKLVMYSLAVTCQMLGCDGFMWQALDWNTPALAFYGKIGSKVQDGLLTTRFAGQALIDFASKK